MRSPSGVTSRISTSSSGPISTTLPARSLPPGRASAVQTFGSGPAGRRSRTSASPPPDRRPRSRAGKTRVSLSATTSPGGISSGRAANVRCEIVRCARSSTRSRLRSRRSAGVCAMRCGGSSKSKSEVRYKAPSGVEEGALMARSEPPIGGGSEPKAAEGEWCGDTPSRRAHEQPVLAQEGLIDLLECARILADRYGQRVEPHGPAVELLDERAQDPGIHLVKAILVDVQDLEGGVSHLGSDHTPCPHLCIVPDPPEQSIGDPRGAARPPSDLLRAIRRDLHLQDLGGTPEDERELVHRIVVEALHDAEARAHRGRQQTEPGGRA